MIDETLLDAEEKMEKSVDAARADLQGVRTGRASPAMFNRIQVEYYGAYTPLPQLASVSVPEARMAVVKPYDQSSLGVMERAIRDSDLGVNPSNDGTIIRVIFPELSEERRREMVKVARSKGEDARVSIRSVRRTAMTELQRIVKDGEAGEDEVARAEKELESTTATYIAKIEDMVRSKEAELLEV